MLFSSLGFLFRFLPVFMILYLFAPAKYRNILLLLGSLVFYAVGEPRFVLLLMCSVAVNYGLSRYMFWEPSSPQQNRRAKTARRRKTALILSLIVDFGLLFVFKYWDFAAGTVNSLAGRSVVPLFALALPLGISFYTFQLVSYQIDCYRGVIEKPAEFVPFAAYICMFPKLISGPVMRYGEMADRMQDRRVNIRKLENGLKLFTAGLGLKVLLADRIGTLWSTIMSAGPGNLHAAVAWLGAAAYSFQIYFDFWGYSVMAMGLGKMLGFRIPRNFDSPYAARSVAEFWRRWHITLGSWFREYVYFPMGGSRRGRLRTVCNLFVVWAFTGLWHGAGWNFLLWGMLFFVILAVEKNSYGKWMEQTRVLGHLYTLLLIPVTWIVFAVTDLGQLAAYLGNLFGVHGDVPLVGVQQLARYLKEYWVLLIACAVFATPYPAKLYDKYASRWFTVAALLVIFWLSVHGIAAGDNNPFMYLKF